MRRMILRTFTVDVTPPLGLCLCGGLQEPGVGVDTPLHLRGLILESTTQRCVIAVLDYCYTIGRSHERFVKALAEAAGTPSSRVALHSNHVHDAPLINEEAHALVQPYVPGLHDEAYFCDVMRRSQSAVHRALDGTGIEIAGIAFASHPVEQFASTRRCVDRHNRCHIRWSVCLDENLRAYPEGDIDPMIDVLVLYDPQGRPVACMSFYACHPQVSNGRRLVSSDTVGVALGLFEQAHPGVATLHFDGCGGDVTAGKYSSTNKPRNRLVFGVRLYDGLEAAFSKAQPDTLQTFDWIDASVELPLAPVPGDSPHYQRIIADPASSISQKYLAALKLNRLRSGIERYPFRASRLGLNAVRVLFLPAEMVVGYQLYAKSILPQRAAVAAYGDCFLNYVGLDHHFPQGGYEVDPRWTEVGPGIEQPIKALMTQLLTR